MDTVKPELKVCEACVMDTTDPDITFNQYGVCNHCIYAAERANRRRAQKLERPWVVHEMKTSNEHDVLLGLSGGVDSSYCLHLLLENGVKPLTFSLDNGYNTLQSDSNVRKLVKTAGVTHIPYKLNLKRFKELQTAFIQSGTANIEIPTDHVLMAATYELARKYEIKTIVSGGNWQTEGVMPKAWGYEAKDLHFIKAIGDTKGLPTISMPQYLYYRFIKRIKTVNLLEYYGYNREEAIKTLQDKYNYQPYGEKHGESKFTKWFQDCYLPQKFGYDKRKPHLSSLIHSNQMTRDEALEELKKPLVCEDRISSDGNKTYKDYPNHEWLWNLLTKLWFTVKLRLR